MTFTYRRTASAVFNTSFTTATAFFGTAVSPVMPINAFGIFAANGQHVGLAESADQAFAAARQHDLAPVYVH